MSEAADAYSDDKWAFDNYDGFADVARPARAGATDRPDCVIRVLQLRKAVRVRIVLAAWLLADFETHRCRVQWTAANGGAFLLVWANGGPLELHAYPRSTVYYVHLVPPAKWSLPVGEYEAPAYRQPGRILVPLPRIGGGA